MSMKARVVCFLFVSIQVTSFSTSAYSGNVPQDSGRNTDGLNEKTKQDLEKLKQSVEELKKSGEEAKASEELQKKVAPLMEQLKVLLKEERYSEAQKVLSQWEALDPHEAQIPLWRDLVSKLEKEPDKKRKEELYLEFVNQLVRGLADTLDTVKQQLTTLNGKLDELKPKTPEEELCNAVAEKDRAKIEKLLAKGVSANAKDSFGGTALSYAALQGNAEIAKLLLAHGADVNAKGLLDSTALISAASKGQVELAKILLSAGADVNAKAKTGATALSAARNSGDADIVELLKQSGAKE